MKNIKEVASSDRLMGGMIIRLRVHPNGDEKNYKRLVINLDDLTKKTDATDAKMNDAFHCLKNVIGQQLSIQKPKRINECMVFRRLFFFASGISSEMKKLSDEKPVQIFDS